MFMWCRWLSSLCVFCVVVAVCVSCALVFKGVVLVFACCRHALGVRCCVRRNWFMCFIRVCVEIVVCVCRDVCSLCVVCALCVVCVVFVLCV